MRSDVSCGLAQKAQDVLNGGSVGQASKADTVPPSPGCQRKGDGQQRRCQGGKEWAGGIAVQNLVRKAEMGQSHQLGQKCRKWQGYPETAHLGEEEAPGAHLLHLSSSAPEEFNVPLTQHALVPAQCSLR